MPFCLEGTGKPIKLRLGVLRKFVIMLLSRLEYISFDLSVSFNTEWLTFLRLGFEELKDADTTSWTFIFTRRMLSTTTNAT